MPYSPILTSMMTRRLEQLERYYRQQAGNPGADKMKYWFRVTPTCPPSTAVHIRGGVMYERGAGAGRGVEVPSALGDFGPGGTWGGSVDPAPAYTTAYYYRGFVVANRGIPTVGYVLGNVYFYDTDEYATAAEAEDGVWTDIIGDQGPYLSEVPLAIVILRNNGTTGTTGQIMPIDAVNRGRSYIWRDIRPRYSADANLLP